jgi:lipoate-protein ligase B
MKDEMPDNCVVISQGLVEYSASWEQQKKLHREVAGGRLPNLLLLLEHAHVYTLGRRGVASDILANPEELLELGVQVHHIDRGGEVTYHGPGQLVGYPIVNLRAWGGGPLAYVRTLERSLISTLAEFGIRGESDDRPTGVWVGDAKITAIGVKVSRGVTMHGFALNVNPDLSYFDHIVPCGMPDAPVTSMAAELGAAELGSPIEVRQVIPVLDRHFGEAFGWETESRTLDELGQGSNVAGLAAPWNPQWHRSPSAR